jgi:hypothetical protein
MGQDSPVVILRSHGFLDRLYVIMKGEHHRSWECLLVATDLYPQWRFEYDRFGSLANDTSMEMPNTTLLGLFSCRVMYGKVDGFIQWRGRRNTEGPMGKNARERPNESYHHSLGVFPYLYQSGTLGLSSSRFRSSLISCSGTNP